MTRTQRLALALGLTALISSAGYAVASRVQEDVVVVAPGPIERRVIARAALTPIDGVSEVRALLDARVLEVHVREGEEVQAGQLLAELEASDLELGLQRAEADVGVLEAELGAMKRGGRREVRRELAAEVRSAQLELKRARAEATRRAQLVDAGASTPVLAEEAEVARDVAEARLAAVEARRDLAVAGGLPEDVRAAEHRLAGARAARERAERERERARLFAPISGTVLARRVDPGDVVQRAGQVLFELADPAQIELRAEIEERHAALVERGAVVSVTELGGARVLGRGRVARLGARVDRRAISGDPSELRADGLVRPVFIELDLGESLRLPIGQRVEVEIALAPETVAARVPRRALSLEDGEARVVVARGLRRASQPVGLGAADARYVEVKGLAAEDKVVVPRE